MRTTLEIDDDLLITAKQLARNKGVTLGRLISDFTRQSLASNGQLKERYGVLPFAPKPGAVRADLEFVNKLRDEE
jgi:hypothetical protein